MVVGEPVEDGIDGLVAKPSSLMNGLADTEAQMFRRCTHLGPEKVAEQLVRITLG